MFLIKRGNIYYIEYFDENEEKIKRVTTKKRLKSDAIKYISEFQKKLKNNNKIKKILLSEFRNEYLSFSNRTHSANYTRSIKLSFKMLEEFIGDIPLKSISEKVVESFLLSTHDRAKYSAYLYHRTLKSSFNKAIQWKYLEINPFSKIKLPKNIKHIPTFIGEDELYKIIRFTTNEILKEIYFTAFYTGLRQSELINLKWGAIDFQNRIITVRNSEEFTTKSKKERVIPMNNIIFNQMKTLKKNSQSDYIFSNPNNYKFNQDYIGKSFKKAVRKAKLSEAIHFHTLRHSFASNLVRKGVSLYVVKELLGHQDISTTQIYAHLDNTALINAVNLL